MAAGVKTEHAEHTELMSMAEVQEPGEAAHVHPTTDDPPRDTTTRSDEYNRAIRRALASVGEVPRHLPAHSHAPHERQQRTDGPAPVPTRGSIASLYFASKRSTASEGVYDTRRLMLR